MEFTKCDALPRRVRIEKVVYTRYSPGERPVSWDDRFDGLESVVSEHGETIHLYSNGGQSSPSAGWELLLTEACSTTDLEIPAEVNCGPTAFSWTLYGIGNNSAEAE